MGRKAWHASADVFFLVIFKSSVPAVRSEGCRHYCRQRLGQQVFANKASTLRIASHPLREEASCI